MNSYLGNKMNSATGLTNLNLKTPELLNFEGIKNGEITNIFNKQAKLESSVIFGRKVEERFAKKFNKKSVDNLEEIHKLRKDLANRRAKILTRNPEQQLNIENDLLKLVDDTLEVQKNHSKTIVEVKSLRKQLKNDICIYFTNEIRKCTSAIELNKLHKRIKDLTPSSQYDKNLKRKLGSKSIKTLQGELNKQCNRVVDQLKIDLDPKRNKASEETNLELEKSGIPSAAENLEQRCRDIIEWIDSIQEISPSTFKKHHELMHRLLRNTYLTGLNSITCHPKDFGETKRVIDTISRLSNAVQETIKNTIDDNQKFLKRISDATQSKISILEKDLKQVPIAASNFQHCSKVVEECNNRTIQIESERSETLQSLNNMRLNKKTLEKTISSGNIFKRKFPRLFDRKNYNELSKVNKDISKLSKKRDKLFSSSATADQELKKAKDDFKAADQALLQLLNHYGSSLKHLDGLSNLPVDKNGIPLRDDVLSALDKAKNPTARAIPKNAQDIMDGLSEQFKKNKSISTSPEHLEQITSCIDKKLSSNPKLSESLAKFLEIYSDLLQPQPGGNEWSFSQTFEYFAQSCEMVSEKDDSVSDAQDNLYKLLAEKFNQNKTTENQYEVPIKADSSGSASDATAYRDNLESEISIYLQGIDKNNTDDEFDDDDDPMGTIKEMISRHRDFSNLSELNKINAAKKIYHLDKASEEKVREILDQLKAK